MDVNYDVISFITTMEKNEKDVQEEDLGDLDKAFEELNNPLNLTDQADKGEEEDPEMAKKIQENYQNFMKEMQNFQLDPGEGDMDDFNGSLQGLLKGLT